jgi:hypothetical protein
MECFQAVFTVAIGASAHPRIRIGANVLCVEEGVQPSACFRSREYCSAKPGEDSGFPVRTSVGRQQSRDTKLLT